MQKKKNLILIFTFFIALSIILVGYTKYYENQDDFTSIPLKIDTHHNFIGLFKNSIIYQTLDQNSTTFYRYYLDTNKTETIGTVNNYILNGGSSVLINNVLYLYITIDCMNNRENALYAINLEDNKLLHLTSDKNTSVLVPLDSLNNDVISLKGNKDKENNTGNTSLVAYNPDTKSENELFSRKLDYDEAIGGIFVNFDIINEKIYILTEIAINGEPENKIEIYDKNFTLLNTIDIDKISVIAQKLGQIILDFKVMGEYIFIRNISGESVIAKISNTNLEVIFEGDELDIASNLTDKKQLNYQVFFERESNNYYLFDEKNGLSKQTLTIEPNSTIGCAFMDENGVLFLLKEETENQSENNESLYYLENSYLFPKHNKN